MLGFFARFVSLTKLGHLLDRVLERFRAALPDRHELGQAIGVPKRHLEHAADIADRRLRSHGGEGDDLRHPVGAIFLRDVTDHLLAALD